MYQTPKRSSMNILRLVRFLAWYGAIVLCLFVFLPEAGSYLEGKYDSLAASARFAGVLGFFVVIAVSQVISARDRWRGAKHLYK
ncbi:MAG: hypothetical protein PVJ33_13405 [Lysobacterales bacterium]|jgi:hypothetical protein